MIQMLDTYHEDIIHDIAFNFNGNRFATASTDFTVKVFQKTQDNKWEKISDFKCHDGPIWRVRWAHPKFGNILATCSHDKGVYIWKEKKTFEESQQGKPELKISWVQKSFILDGKEDIADIQFGQKNYGLLLAIAYVDGRIVFYKEFDSNQFLETGHVKTMNYGARVIAWNTAPLEDEILAVGGNNQENAYRDKNNLNETKEKYLNQALGSSEYEINLQKNVSTLHLYRTDSNAQDGYKMVKLFEFDSTETINDLQWANQNGRSFHLIGICDKNGVKIYKFNVKDKNVNVIQTFIPEQRKLTAYRMSWNVMANSIAVAFQNKQICLFQYNHPNWVAKGIINESVDQKQHLKN